MVDLIIIMPSYNKENYIAKALDSIFEQETTYSYNIIVADDCSNDKTVEIVKQYQESYPDKITLLTSECNQKLFKNVIRAYKLTNSEYFCVLDPDDYWINKKHIQNALDFMNKHKDYTIYSTNTIKLNKDGTEEKICFSKKPIISTYEDYLEQKAIISFTQSVVYRNIVFKNGVPNKMLNLECSSQERSFRGDSFRNAIHIHEGKAYFSPDYDGVYSITDDGIWQSMSEVEQNLLNATIYKDLWLFYNKKDFKLLFIAYKLFMKIEKILFSSLIDLEKRGKLQYVISSICELQRLFSTYEKELILINKKNFTFCSNIAIKLYKYLKRKLEKKGVI